MTDLLAPGPPLTAAGERLVEAASVLFYRHGIRAVGVDLIAETAGTTKKTLYDRFGSKDALVALCLRRRAVRWQAFLGERLDAHPPGTARVLAVFDSLGEWLADQDRGCAFVNAYAEIGGTDHPGLPVIRAEKEWMRATFVRVAGNEVLADRLHLLYEGATVLATAGGRAGAVAGARAAARHLMRSDVTSVAGSARTSAGAASTT